MEEIPNGATWWRKTFPDSVDRHNVISTWISDTSEIKAGEQRQRIFSVVCKNGEKKEILFRPVQLSNGQHIITTEDITERRRAEEDLIISEANYRTIFNSVEDAIFLHDPSTGEVLDVNAKMLEMFGYSAEEARSLTVEGLGSGDPPYTQVEALRAIREANLGQAKLLEWQTKDKNGRPFWVEVSLKRCVINNRDTVLAVVRDITERKRAEEALLESEARFREFAEAVPQVVYELDAQGNFTFLNRAGLALGGYSPENIDRGMKLTEFIAPEDRERLLKNIRNALRGKGTYGNEYTVVTIDGTRVQVAAYTSPIVKADKVVGIRGVCVDIRKLKEAEAVLQRSRSELEKLVADRTAEVELANEQLKKEILERINTQEALALSEQRFRAIFETAKDCVYLKDTSLRYTFVNPSMATLLDLPESTILGKTDFDLFGTSAGEHLSAVDKRILNGEVVEEEHTRLVQGVPLTFLDVRAPLTNAQGEITGICGIACNITERTAVSSSRHSPNPSSRSGRMKTAISAARLVASSESIVMISGESGTGKDRLARYIHDQSPRSSGPFYTINCAAIPFELAESELFGHEAGAFTGATRRKRGLLEIAEGGTLLLNEIGDMPLHLQSKLLAFLDSMSFTRLGGVNSVTVNVRLIAATNRNLAEEISAGRFRQDLFYRLNVFSIRLPPLRERLEDIPMLVEELLSEVGPLFGYREAAHERRQIIEILTNYSWPGNVRELRNVLERAIILSQGGPLKLEHLQVSQEQSPVDRLRVSMPIDGPLPEVLGGIERSLIKEALQRSYGNKKKAAKLLGLSRFALARHMEKLGIHTYPATD